MGKNSKKVGCEPSRHTKMDGSHRKRIVVVDHDKARPNSAAFNYLKQLAGKCDRSCIEMVSNPDNGQVMIQISEQACLACLTRAKQCPGSAVKVVNLPSELSTDLTHSYGTNFFKLHGLPTPKRGHVLGLLGCNGVGKSTALSILSGTIKPNLGVTDTSWEEIVRYYRGSALQNYFQNILEGKLKCVSKPQLEQSFVDQFADKKVGDCLRECNERSNLDELIQKLGLSHLLERQVQKLSGGELQRFAVCKCAIQIANVYMFDEPSLFLDVKQRLAVADVIRGLVDGENGESSQSNYVIVVEHDLAVLDYLSDFVCCLYGQPAAYGVVTQCSKTANGINQFISGYFTAENVRFRDESLSFQISQQEETKPRQAQEQPIGEYHYPAMSKTHVTESSSFTLLTEPGNFRQGEVIGLLAQNGSGKTTFMEGIARDYEHGNASGKLQNVSFKRQHVTQMFRRFNGTVEQLLEKHMQWGLGDRMFRLMVMKPLLIDNLMDLEVRSLSGGEMQRLAICICLGKPAQLYLLDEPSAGLDCEQRLVLAKVIKRWIVSHLNKTVFLIEHDMILASALCDRVIIFQGTPGVQCTAGEPLSPHQGLNTFLGQLQVTFYHSHHSNRPRINKRGSRRDREQKACGNYFDVHSTANAIDE